MRIYYSIRWTQSPLKDHISKKQPKAHTINWGINDISVTNFGQNTTQIKYQRILSSYLYSSQAAFPSPSMWCASFNICIRALQPKKKDFESVSRHNHSKLQVLWKWLLMLVSGIGHKSVVEDLGTVHSETFWKGNLRSSPTTLGVFEWQRSLEEQLLKSFVRLKGETCCSPKAKTDISVFFSLSTCLAHRVMVSIHIQYTGL